MRSVTLTEISQCSGGNHLVVHVAVAGGTPLRLHIPWAEVEAEREDDPVRLLLTLVRNDLGRFLRDNPGASRVAMRTHLLSQEYFI